MRNKILVLVLALVCLLSVSALAANVTDKVNADQKSAIGTALTSFINEGHTPYKAAKPENYTTFGTSSDYIVASFTAAADCSAKTNGSIVFVCDCSACKAAGFDFASSKGTLIAKKLPAISLVKPAHTQDVLGDHVDATCTAAGWAVYTCNGCDEDIKWQGDPTKANYDAALAKQKHDLKDNTVAKTCVAYGYTESVCKVCGYQAGITYNYEGGYAQHKYEEETVVVSYESCLQAGQTKTTKICSVCHTADPKAPVTYTPVKKITHDMDIFEDVYEYYFTPSTKKTNAAGLRYVYINNEVTKAATEATYHVTADNVYIVKEGALTYTYEKATCTTEGIITISCGHCKKTVQYAVAAFNHFPVDHRAPEKLEDCTKTYNVAYTCARCGELFEEVWGGEIAHEYGYEPDFLFQYQNNGLIRVEFWRNEDGKFVDENGNEPAECMPYTEVYGCHHCIWCGDHEYWEEWFRHCDVHKFVEVKPAATAKHSKVPAEAECYKYTKPTCTSTGSATYACATCGETVTAPVEKLDHVYEKWTVVTKPSCTGEGLVKAECKNCKNPVEEKLPALKHEMKLNETLSVPANTCVAGLAVYTCDNCDAKDTQVLPAPHNDTGLTKEQYTTFIDSTCAKSGTKTFKCNDCNKPVTVEIEKKAHKLTNVSAIVDATAHVGAYYTKGCANCTAVEVVFVSEALGHADLTAAELKLYREQALEGTLPANKFIVKGTIDCENGATGSKLCKESYKIYEQQKDGSWKLVTKTCDKEWNFEIPAREHAWSEIKIDAVTGKYYMECHYDDCDAIKETVFVKPEYKVELDGTKGKVTMTNPNATPLAYAWVRISYGFELSDGSYLAMTTCMPITFAWDEDGNQYGTFSFFALNTSLESTGVNIMVVDQYDAMYKSIGELVGNNYGMYIG